MTDNLLIVFYYFLAYVVSLFLGTIIINPIVGRLSRRYFPKNKWDLFLPRVIGIIEQFMYTTCFLLGKPEFIAVWLVLKLAGEWRQTEGKELQPMYSIFLIGNALSLIFGVGTALFIQRFLPLFP